MPLGPRPADMRSGAASSACGRRADIAGIPQGRHARSRCGRTGACACTRPGCGSRSPARARASSTRSADARVRRRRHRPGRAGRRHRRCERCDGRQGHRHQDQDPPHRPFLLGRPSIRPAPPQPTHSPADRLTGRRQADPAAGGRHGGPRRRHGRPGRRRGGPGRGGRHGRPVVGLAPRQTGPGGPDATAGRSAGRRRGGPLGAVWGARPALGADGGDGEDLDVRNVAAGRDHHGQGRVGGPGERHRGRPGRALAAGGDAAGLA